MPTTSADCSTSSTAPPEHRGPAPTRRPAATAGRRACRHVASPRPDPEPDVLQPTTRTHRQLLVVVAVLVACTVAGLVALWPGSGDVPDLGDRGTSTVAAEVTSVELTGGEPDPVTGSPGDTGRIGLRILEGDEAGAEAVVELFLDGYPDFEVGDRVAVAPATQPGDGPTEWFITDFQRLPTLLWLVGLFVAAVLVIGRWHGLRSLLGLALSLLIVVRFVVPAILAGSNPPLVALVGALAVMVVTLYLAHGVNEMTTAAIVGTAGALALTVGLALVFIDRAKITGFSSEDAVLARFAVDGLDLQGLVLAGLIIAALGVLDDVTVSQASTVFALHDTDRTLSVPALFARAMRVGRDHIASVVNTLFLAYAGASLALLVLFSTGGQGVAEILNYEILATEIVKTVVGSLGLIAAVPLTTALAALVAVRRPADAPSLGGGHAHGHAAVTVDPQAADDASPGAPDRSWARYLRDEVRGGEPTEPEDDR
ncbi:YibE/F family protein [Nitriliruptoraceae bacterium ZYF776]|nr:YibE/F family protein [Profundirhabdus halotolerans]